MQQNLAQRQLDPNSATDNVHAGVMYLKQLLDETGGDESTAIAGYYQGLQSVRDRGMYDDTAAVRRERAGAARPLRRLSGARHAVQAGSTERTKFARGAGSVPTFAP